MHNNSSDRSVTGDEQITSWVTSPVLCRSSTTFALYCTACWCHMIIYSLYISSYDTHSFICSLQIHAAWFEFMIMIPRPVVSPEMNVSPCAFTHCHSTYCKFNAFWQFTSWKYSSVIDYSGKPASQCKRSITRQNMNPVPSGPSKIIICASSSSV